MIEYQVGFQRQNNTLFPQTISFTRSFENQVPYKNASYAFRNTFIFVILHLTQPAVYQSVSIPPHILLTTELI